MGSGRGGSSVAALAIDDDPSSSCLLQNAAAAVISNLRFELSGTGLGNRDEDTSFESYSTTYMRFSLSWNGLGKRCRLSLLRRPLSRLLAFAASCSRAPLSSSCGALNFVCSTPLPVVFSTPTDKLRLAFFSRKIARVYLGLLFSPVPLIG